MSIITKKGDGGKTEVRGKVVDKDSDLIEVLGSIDELIAVIGLGKNKTLINKTDDLYTLMGYLAGYRGKKVDWKEKVVNLEEEIDKKEKKILKIDRFMKTEEMEPWINLARVVCRRTERRLVKYIKVDKKADLNILKYINRLSDYFFICSIKK